MKYYKEIIIAILLAVIIIQRSCRPDAPIVEPDEVQTVTVVKVDTVVLRDTTYIPVVRYRTKIDTKVDTVFVIQEFYTKNFYLDTILKNAKGMVIIADTVFKNQIISRKPTITLYPETITTTNTITKFHPTRTKVFVGFGLHEYMGTKLGMSGNLALMTKKDHLYSVYFDPIQRSFGINIYWKLKWQK